MMKCIMQGCRAEQDEQGLKLWVESPGSKLLEELWICQTCLEWRIKLPSSEVEVEA